MLRALMCPVLSALVALSACAGAKPAPDCTSDDEQRKIESVALTFFQGLAESDPDRYAPLVGVPFTWDARCRVLAAPDEVTERFVADQPEPGSIRVDRARIVEPDSEPLDERTRRNLQDVSLEVTGCDDDTQALIASLGVHPTRFVLIDIVTPKERIPTVVRLSQIEGRWLVTGFDN